MSQSYDVIVIGGGPAGMMAASTASARGLRVLLLEKNPTLGKKLLITGGGRCNVTNAEPNVRTFLSHYGVAQKFLFSTFAQYDATDTINFFTTHGVATKIEDRGRVFPVSDSAHSIWQVLVDELRNTNVTVETNANVTGITASNGRISGVQLGNGTTISSPSVIIATGGKSRPETGSTGDGFAWLAKLGHTIHEPDASLVPLRVHDAWVKQLAGVALSDIKVTIKQNDLPILTRTGRILFTHEGLSGPTILNLSRVVGEHLAYGPVILTLNLFPTLDHGTLDEKLITLLQTESNKLCKNALTSLFPQSIVATILSLSGIPLDTPCHSVTKPMRRTLMHRLKELPLSISGLLGTDKAIVTSGGVDLSEVDWRTMASRKVNGLYIVGDLLNIDRPSGGFSLQLCWSTGYVAGRSVPIPSTTIR
jgi:predicted Rossmann fold flavoprotein